MMYIRIVILSLAICPVIFQVGCALPSCVRNVHESFDHRWARTLVDRADSEMQRQFPNVDVTRMSVSNPSWSVIEYPDGTKERYIDIRYQDIPVETNAQCLPREVYVDAYLVRLGPDGSALGIQKHSEMVTIVPTEIPKNAASKHIAPEAVFEERIIGRLTDDDVATPMIERAQTEIKRKFTGVDVDALLTSGAYFIEYTLPNGKIAQRIEVRFRDLPSNWASEPEGGRLAYDVYVVTIDIVNHDAHAEKNLERICIAPSGTGPARDAPSGTDRGRWGSSN